MIQYHVIGIAYTRTCPLACSHCMTESSPQAKGRMTVAQVQRYLPAVRRFSAQVAFSGGEPLLYHHDIVALTAEARRVGLGVSLSTGAGWVKDEAMARARVAELAAAGLGRMLVSWDVYHEAFAPRAHAVAVARAACDAGIDVEVRIVNPPNRCLEEYQAPFRGLPVRFESLAPGKLGTAEHLPDADFAWSDGPPKGACDIVLRPAIEPDGMVYACSGPGHFSRRPSPLVLGNAEEEALDEILARAVADPILEAINLIGPYGLYRLLADRDDGPQPPHRSRYTGICDLCLDLNGQPEVIAALRTRLAEPAGRMLLTAARLRAEHGCQ